MPIYVFGAFEFDTDRRELRQDGTPCDIEPKAFNVLSYLIENRSQAVSKADLIKACWSEENVADAAVTRCINIARQAVGDSGVKQHTILTIRRHGYRFTAPVRIRQEAHRSPADDRSEVSPGQTSDHGTTAIAGDDSGPLSPSQPGKPAEAQAETPSDLADSPANRSLLKAERRHLTVMSCELADADTLTSQLSLDDYDDVIWRYQNVCSALIARFNGHIAQNHGTGFTVYFGYPSADETDVHRAVRAGLEILSGLVPLKEALRQEKNFELAVRLGIHTGQVIMRELISGGQPIALAVGEAPSLATQIQAIAEPDNLLISTNTAKLVDGFLTCQDYGLHILPGLTTSISLVRVEGLSGAQHRLDVLGGAGLTPFVGREAVKTSLLESWNQAQAGLGRMVLLSGEPGIGKSRLVHFMQGLIPEGTAIRLSCRCSPYHQFSALYPIIDLLTRLLQWQPDDTPTDKYRKLESTLTQHALSSGGIAPLFASLLSLPRPEDYYPPLNLTAPRQREKTLEAILSLFLALTHQSPVLLVVEDLHWVDPSTLNLLHLLAPQVPTMRLCVVLTFRSDFEVPWPSHAYIVPITLSRLLQDEASQMVTHVAGGKALPHDVLEQIVDKADGVPLAVEELTKAVIESESMYETERGYELTDSLSALSVPATLNDSLMARLDRLGPAKAVVQLGATIGRRFPYVLLQAVWPQDLPALQQRLEQLMEAELIYQQGWGDQATYMFKHVLIQQIAYDSIPERTRENLHRHNAQVVETHFPKISAFQPALLAYQYTAASMPGQALPHWLGAAEEALGRSAYPEALAHIGKGLTLLEQMPDDSQRAQQELKFQIARRSALIATEGLTAPGVEAACSRAWDLCQQVNDAEQSIWALRGLCAYYLIRGQLVFALEVAERSLDLAHQTQDPIHLLSTHASVGACLTYRGDLMAARDHFEQAIALHNEQSDSSVIVAQGLDARVSCLCQSMLVSWMLGYPAQAEQRRQAAFELAKQTQHHLSLAQVFYFSALLHHWRQEPDLAREQAEACLTLSQQHGFPQWLAYADMVKHASLIDQGEAHTAINKIQQALEINQQSGTRLAYGTFMGQLAKVYGKAHCTGQNLKHRIGLINMGFWSCDRILQ